MLRLNSYWLRQRLKSAIFFLLTSFHPQSSKHADSQEVESWTKLKTSQVTMKTLVFVSLVGLFLHDTTAEMHSLKYFFTASSEVTNFPEFVAVGMVDDIQTEYYDSNTKRTEPKQDWMNRVTEDKADYWEWQTERAVFHQQLFKGNLDTLKRRFNQTGGVHIYQEMVGCEWDDETGDVNGYHQIGYDGEDFLVLDMKTWTYIAAQQQAVFTKQELNNNKAGLEYRKNYLAKECPDWLKKYVDYGRSSLMRTDLPTVSLLQKTPSSRVTCHATGFYPNRAMMFWRKDGEELHEDVDKGEILPNHDGSFQISADLQLPSDDWGKYDCVFQLSGVKEDIVTKLDKREIKTNSVNPMNPVIPITIIAIIAALVLLGLAVIGYKKYRGRKSTCETSSENSSELAEKLNPEPT
ncbi:major histocompatibility complex class I-related gene protein-like isoform X2 [Labrus mixtus]|uniref:major histocompatibility complex class I-related gene protein-like isoform X2 n=1 Tax=Labrus mixtus TaxID=508554 RepID=UPI0029C03270|nr:major histocompatibility complex class I-related gene protein-like isoform X2 [Labrus mixtus]